MRGWRLIPHHHVTSPLIGQDSGRERVCVCVRGWGGWESHVKPSFIEGQSSLLAVWAIFPLSHLALISTSDFTKKWLHIRGISLASTRAKNMKSGMLREQGLFSQVISGDSRYTALYSLRGAREKWRTLCPPSVFKVIPKSSAFTRMSKKHTRVSLMHRQNQQGDAVVLLPVSARTQRKPKDN